MPYQTQTGIDDLTNHYFSMLPAAMGVGAGSDTNAPLAAAVIGVWLAQPPDANSRTCDVFIGRKWLTASQTIIS